MGQVYVKLQNSKRVKWVLGKKVLKYDEPSRSIEYAGKNVKRADAAKEDTKMSLEKFGFAQQLSDTLDYLDNEVEWIIYKGTEES